MSSNSAKAQARVLLQALCKFILPTIRTVIREKTIRVEQISSGAEADELLIELEKLISVVISPSRPRTKDLAIETTLDKSGRSAIYHPDVSPAIPFQNSAYAISRSIRYPEADRKVGEELRKLRTEINQRMPIRLLCFEPHTGNSKLKISLLEKNEIYDYIAPKVRADVYRGRSQASSEYTQYAILSHTWTQTPGELTYGDWKNGLLESTKPKYQKLINFCKTAWNDHGLALGWIDTVCINKESSAELDESIRSMYAWYCNANVCITYLAETKTLSDIHNDPWFGRGWTFQELVAPSRIKFYNLDWDKLSKTFNDKYDVLIQKEINLATTITQNELYHIWRASISRRMQLAAQRQVTREEDAAYCLMGIFDVSISTAYGEGLERAFFRLVDEIFRTTQDVSDIFNWAGNCTPFSRQPTSLFPYHLSNYLNRSSNEQLRPWRPIEPHTLTHLGLRTPILLMPAVSIHELIMDRQPIGDYWATVAIAPFTDTDGIELPKDYHLLDKRASGLEGLHTGTSKFWRRTSTLTFGALNVEEQGTSIHIPITYLAVLLRSEVELQWCGPEGGQAQKTSSLQYKRIYTEKPIVFGLKKTKNHSSDDRDKHYYELKRSELAKHGMELITLYL